MIFFSSYLTMSFTVDNYAILEILVGRWQGIISSLDSMEDRFIKYFSSEIQLKRLFMGQASLGYKVVRKNIRLPWKRAIFWAISFFYT